MNVTYQMDEDDKGNQMDEENHDMDENSLSNLPNFGTGNRKNPFNWGFVLRVECPRRDRAAMAVTAQQWGKRERRGAHREREMMGRCALPGIAGTRQKKENKFVERGFGGTRTTSTAAVSAKDLKKC